MSVEVSEIRLKGTPISAGIAIGKLVPMAECADMGGYSSTSSSTSDVETEVGRYRHAVKKSQEDVERLKNELAAKQVKEGAQILEGHIQMMYDPIFSMQVENEIRSTYQNAEYVFQKNMEECHDKLYNSKNPFFKERSSDVKDVQKRVMGYLRENEGRYTAFAPNSIICTPELTPSMVSKDFEGQVIAFITQKGSITSHASIVARARGMPYVSDIDFSKLQTHNYVDVIVDGIKGEVIIYPSKETLEAYQRAQRQFLQDFTYADKLDHLPSETYDGYHVDLFVNLDVDDELEVIQEYGTNGVGLYRSEQVFLSHSWFPSEEEQFVAYKRLVQKMKGLPIVIRTFDIGGDKWNVHPIGFQEFSPSLNTRAIRFLLKEKEIFKTQIRAILRSAVYGKVNILFPMITSLSELLEAKALIQEVMHELTKQNVPFDKPNKIGCMIEVPSAAIITDLLAKECDFLSIGTNDLVQYSLAVDRENGHPLVDLHASHHPGILRLIRLVVIEANRQRIPVTVCGEAAADARIVPLLLGLGVHGLSVALKSIPNIKKWIRQTSIVKAVALAEEALSLSSTQDIQKLLDHYHQQSFPF